MDLKAILHSTSAPFGLHMAPIGAHLGFIPVHLGPTGPHQTSNRPQMGAFGPHLGRLWTPLSLMGTVEELWDGGADGGFGTAVRDGGAERRYSRVSQMPATRCLLPDVFSAKGSQPRDLSQGFSAKRSQPSVLSLGFLVKRFQPRHLRQEISSMDSQPKKYNNLLFGVLRWCHFVIT